MVIFFSPADTKRKSSYSALTGIWTLNGTNNYTLRALKHEGEHIPSQCFVVMRPNSRKVPKEARREKNTMLAVSHQHKSARERADDNTC